MPSFLKKWKLPPFFRLGWRPTHALCRMVPDTSMELNKREKNVYLQGADRIYFSVYNTQPLSTPFWDSGELRP